MSYVKNNPCKIIIIGHINVGKTTLANYLAFDKFGSPTSSTIGVEFKSVNYNGINYQFWDTAGQERFDSIVQIYWRNTSFIVAVISLNPYEMSYSIQRVIQYLDRLIEDNINTPLILWFSKLDSNTGISIDDIKFEYDTLFNHSYVRNYFVEYFIVDHTVESSLKENKVKLFNTFQIIFKPKRHTQSVIKLERSTNVSCCITGMPRK